MVAEARRYSGQGEKSGVLSEICTAGYKGEVA